MRFFFFMIQKQFRRGERGQKLWLSGKVKYKKRKKREVCLCWREKVKARERETDLTGCAAWVCVYVGDLEKWWNCSVFGKLFFLIIAWNIICVCVYVGVRRSKILVVIRARDNSFREVPLVNFFLCFNLGICTVTRTISGWRNENESVLWLHIIVLKYRLCGDVCVYSRGSRERERC